MKKILSSILFLSCSAFMVSSFAGGMVNKNIAYSCDYTDNMHIQGPAGTHIISLQGNGITAQQVNPQYFLIIGSCETGSDGTVVARIGINDTSYTTLTIQDGQLMWNPEVILIDNEGGYQYRGIDHPIGTFEYTLKFSR